MRRFKFLLAAIAATLAALPGAASAQAGGEYVSLGDSFVAGPLIPAQLPPFGCLKSSNNYPHLAALRLQIALKDPSCSGAETEDMTAPQGVSPEPNPPQFDSLSAATTMVTLGIGGNDIGFSEIARNCMNAQSPEGSPCKDRYTAGGTDQISQRIAATEPKVAEVFDGIASRTATGPDTKVYLVNYAAILPHRGKGCWPQMPVARGDVVWLREKHEELNAMLARVAASKGAEVVDWYAASKGHDACQLPGVRWVEGVVPVNAAAPLHPNLQGMIAASNLVVAAATAP